MKKTKSTPVPLPGSKKPTPPQSSSAKAALSNEFIESSDDSAAEEARPSKAQKSPPKQKKTVTIAVHRPKTNGAVKKSQVPLPSQAAAPKKAANSKQNAESSSSEESGDESAEAKTSARANGNKTAAKDTDSVSSGSSSSSVVSSDSEDEDTPAPRATREEAPAKQSKSHTVEFRAVQPFVPPKGFAAIPTPLKASSEAAKLFENLEGKQIWHITAPAGVPISELKKVAMDKAMAGGAVLTHKDIDYGFSAGDKDEEANCEVLVPRSNGYKAVPTRISQTLHLQQVVRLPNLNLEEQEKNTGDEVIESITKSTIRAPREQLKGLKMRYFHSGFGKDEPGTLGSSDSEAEPPAQANGTHVPKKAAKRKLEEVAGVESPEKKHKKHRTPEEIKKREQKKARRREEKGKA